MSLTKVSFSMIKDAYLNVMDFGAVGDFSTDDTAAIQAAIDYAEASATPPSAAPGVVGIYFPFGIYKLTDALTVTKSLSFVGEGHSEYSTGARLIQETAATDHFTVSPIPAGCSVSWDNLTMIADGNGGTAGSCINVGKGCNSVRIRGCTFGTPQSLAIKLQGNDDVQIDGNLFDVTATNFIQLGTSTAANVVSNCSITNNTFFQTGQKTINLYNVSGLLIEGNRVYKSPGSNDALVFIDATNSLPYQIKNVTISGNNITNVNSFLLATSPNGLNIVGNTISNFGAGTGATLNGIDLTGSPVDVSIVGNVFSGSFDTKNFYNDPVSTIITNANISGNTFTNTGGTGQALKCYNTRGVISGNTFYGFATYSVSESVATSGSTFTPGTITTLSSYTQNITLTGAVQGDNVIIGTPYTVWPVPIGIEIIGYVSAPNTVTFKYRNVTGGSIVVSAHDLIYTVTRSL